MASSAGPRDLESRGSVSFTAIAERAFHRWIVHGQPPGTQVTDWLEAESELRESHEQARQLAEIQQRVSAQFADQKLAQLRLSVEHAVTQVLMASPTLGQAGPDILQSICQSLDWEVGVMWIVDSQSSVLRCAEIWQTSTQEFDRFVQVTQEQTFAPGIGLPGRVWATQLSESIPDVAKKGCSLRGAAAGSVGLHGAVAFPIQNGAAPLGVFEFLCREIRGPDAEVAEMMVSIGSQISQFSERRRAESIVSRDHEQRLLAGRIQQSLFPKNPPAVAGVRICGRCVSALDVGGDYYDFFPLGVDARRYIGILVADASGHGFGSALLAAEARAAVRALAPTCENVGHLLTFANQRLANPETEAFVTAFLLRLEPDDSNYFEYANAGHCPGIVFDENGTVLQELTSTGIPLGIEPMIVIPTERSTSLHRGRLILLFTDGAIEACSRTGELFGLQRLLGVVREHRRETPDGIIDEVYCAIKTFCESEVLNDDITVIIVKVDADARRTDDGG